MATVLPSSYDQVPYPNLSHATSHPDRLATLATLLGLTPAPIARCRVLELGCASGGNLVPMAWGLPESEFMGIDNSSRQIAAGLDRAARLGLGNITLQCRDILEIDEDLGQFDYIIAHGVYSWVPSIIRDKVLQICKRNLAPHGVAFVSYNTYPGWHMMNILRDAMLYHTRKLSDPQERITQARAMVGFMAESVPVENQGYRNFLNVYAGFLESEQKKQGTKGDASLLHDELEEINEPIYFYQFAEHAAEHGLQYLIEAELASVQPDNLTPEVWEAVQGMAQDIVDMEQYMDFLLNRMLRQTLLCHEGITVQRMIAPQRLYRLYVASRALPVADKPDLHSAEVEQFRIADKATLSTGHPVIKAAMLCLSDSWPRAIAFGDLLDAAHSRVGRDAMTESDAASTANDAYVLAANLLQAHSHSPQLVELHVHAPRVTAEVSEYPQAIPVARLQAQEGVIVTNVWHERVRLNPLQCHLLPHVDGTRDRNAFLDHIVDLVGKGVLRVEQEGQFVQDSQAVRTLLVDEVEQSLGRMAQSALLEG